MIIANNAIPLEYAAKRIKLPINAAGIAEIRLRTGRKAAAVALDGRIMHCSEAFSQQDINNCFLELCRNSIHSFSREISEGYITLPQGHRVGFCGTAVYDGGRITGLKDISSLNIRFAREVRGCAERLVGTLFSQGLCSVIVCGKPMSGKTTLLRDMARLLGSSHSVCVVDSRGEIAAVSGGVPALDVGENTDVLNGYAKQEGIMTAIRSLSPEIIICDEIGNDAQSVIQCAECGVRLIVSAHAGSIEQLKRRPSAACLLPYFDKAVLLGERFKPAAVEELVR